MQSAGAARAAPKIVSCSLRRIPAAPASDGAVIDRAGARRQWQRVRPAAPDSRRVCLGRYTGTVKGKSLASVSRGAAPPHRPRERPLPRQRVAEYAGEEPSPNVDVLRRALKDASLSSAQHASIRPHAEGESSLTRDANAVNSATWWSNVRRFRIDLLPNDYSERVIAMHSKPRSLWTISGWTSRHPGARRSTARDRARDPIGRRSRCMSC
jgi:hypothetical protein